MSLCRHLSAQEIVNWVTTADGCVHTDDTTKLLSPSCEFVFTPPTPTRQNSFVPSAVCIGHNQLRLTSLGAFQGLWGRGLSEAPGGLQLSSDGTAVYSCTTTVVA